MIMIGRLTTTQNMPTYENRKLEDFGMLTDFELVKICYFEKQQMITNEGRNFDL